VSHKPTSTRFWPDMMFLKVKSPRSTLKLLSSLSIKLLRLQLRQKLKRLD
jgi:hypothetical protein